MNAPAHCPQGNFIIYFQFVLLLLRLITNLPTMRHPARPLCPSRFAFTPLPCALRPHRRREQHAVILATAPDLRTVGGPSPRNIVVVGSTETILCHTGT